MYQIKTTPVIIPQPSKPQQLVKTPVKSPKYLSNDPFFGLNYII
jgi:hypothetical protein